ncbi:MAG: DUF983 domain-containing protein [Paracoccaceae bacterium]
MLNGYISVRQSCAACGENLHHHKADDMPAYVVIVIVGKFLVAVLVAVEIAWSPPIWIYWAIWPALTLLLALLLLPRVKGAVVGMQWALGMHGFGEDDDAGSGDDDPGPDAGHSSGSRP